MSRNWEWNLHGQWEPNTLQIKKVNEVHMKIEAEPVIKQEKWMEYLLGINT